MLGDLLYNLREIEFFFNLFGYISFRSGLSLVTSFFIVLILMPQWIRIQQNFFPSGQQFDMMVQIHITVKELTFGGILILFSIILSTTLWTSNFQILIMY